MEEFLDLCLERRHAEQTYGRTYRRALRSPRGNCHFGRYRLSIARFFFLPVDALAAAVVGGMIGLIGVRLIGSSVAELIDRGLTRERLARLRELIRSVDGVHDLHLLRTRRMGGHALVDVHVQLSPRISLSEAHYISEQVRSRLISADREVSDVTVHVDPEADDTMDELNLKLPSREQLQQVLVERWKHIDEAARIERMDLHYLAGRVHVEVYLPAELADDAVAARALRVRLQQACTSLSYVADVQVWYAAPVERP